MRTEKEHKPSKSWPEHHFVDTGRVRLHYVDWGRNGPPVLLLHGDMRTSRSWDAVASDLCDRYHVISVDARGHGDSEWTSTGYGFEDRVEDMKAFCDQIGLTWSVGVAHSSGGIVMTLLAERCPGLFERLILLESKIPVDEGFQRTVSRPVDRPRSTWPSREALHQRLKEHPVAGRWRQDVIRDVVDHEAMELPDGTIDMKWAPESMAWAEREGDYVDLSHVFPNLNVPILYISGGNRPEARESAARIKLRVPKFNTVVVEDTGHNMYMERPDAVSGLIDAFARHEPLPERV